MAPKSATAHGLFNWTDYHVISVDSVAEVDYRPRGTRLDGDVWTKDGPRPNVTDNATISLKPKHSDEWLRLYGEDADRAWVNFRRATRNVQMPDERRLESADSVIEADPGAASS